MVHTPTQSLYQDGGCGPPQTLQDLASPRGQILGPDAFVGVALHIRVTAPVDPDGLSPFEERLERRLNELVCAYRAAYDLPHALAYRAALYELIADHYGCGLPSGRALTWAVRASVRAVAKGHTQLERADLAYRVAVEHGAPFKALLQALEAMCEVERGSVIICPLPMEFGGEEQAQAPDVPGL